MAPAILCFGELLWDELPGGRRPGGAPVNVAYHLTRLGRAALPISAVGDDADGRALLDFLQSKGIPTGGIAVQASLTTGSVRARIDDEGNARYDIATGTAWDKIPVEGMPLRHAAAAPALVFGSLAQHSSANRAALRRLRGALAGNALQVFDVNLRAPHDDLDRVGALARGASVLKVNHEEAIRLARGASGDPETNARAIAAGTGVPMVCVTAGGEGAGLLNDGEWVHVPGRAITVVDTVGAGDAFLAALVDGLLAGKPALEILARACRLGEWVATQTGAMPDCGPGEVLGR
jgi:fructokinase